MIQRRVVVTAKQCEENFHPMEILFTRELLTKHIFFALNGAFCGWPGRGERLLRAKLFWGGAGARNQVQSRAEYRCTLLSSSASSQRDLAAPL